jgi:DNA-binding protein Fis
MARAKILAVDQDAEGYETLKSDLARYGYEIHPTTTVAKALALAGAHAYQAALIALPFVHERTLLDGLFTEIPDLPIMLLLVPGEDRGIPPQVFQRAACTMGKPLALEPMCLMLDRTLELATLRAMVRRQRQDELSWQRSCLRAEGVEAQSEGSPGSLSESMAHKLRAIVPSLAVLGGSSLHRAVLSYVERLLLTIVLTECRGNQVKSADILGINRNTLRKKIRELGLSVPRGHS